MFLLTPLVESELRLRRRLQQLLGKYPERLLLERDERFELDLDHLRLRDWQRHGIFQR